MAIAQNWAYVQDVLYSGFAGAKNRLCQMGKTAIASHEKRVFGLFAERKFLSLMEYPPEKSILCPQLRIKTLH